MGQEWGERQRGRVSERESTVGERRQVNNQIKKKRRQTVKSVRVCVSFLPTITAPGAPALRT